MKCKSPLRRSRILIAIFFYSSVVGFTSSEKDDGEKTWIDFVAGFGSLTKVVRDCNGNVIQHDDYPFVEGGISIQHNYGYAAFTGKVSAFRVRRKTFNIPSPYRDSSSDLFFASTGIGAAMGLNTPFFELDAGVLYFNNLQIGYFPIEGSHYQPMGKLRLGFEDSWYFSTSLLYNNTLMSQGGMFDIGFGFRIPDSKSSLWIGLGIAPYSDDQWILRAEIAPTDWKAHVLLSGNVGFGADGSTEYGLSLGLRINLQ